ncbi:MAG: helix-turn-helix domain-containing protein [Melioribacteraceae bacterium]|nr:helix-turn-helix domain-containing protein [Melioribacteraceae bacterium]MCF8356744.1 helix-turn-helix domain-containing protein [Melioribacteraceae bacterium]MCF8395967.1 helix-turn-helix domain-containing protein [Melioribacteraceae bacterium]MCF8419530.1 helix-turn-helix domain-containing protein [Melioribacteraceae bacterium]
MRKKHVGSSFDDFLEKEGLLVDAETTAIKRVIAFKLQQMMNEDKMTKSELAKRMKTSRSSVDRLLDPKNESVSLQTLQRAAIAFGRRLHVNFVS